MSDHAAATQLARNLFPDLAHTLDRALATGGPGTTGAPKPDPRAEQPGAETGGRAEGARDSGAHVATPPAAFQPTDESAFEAQLGHHVGEFRRRNAALAWNDVADVAARERVLTSFDRVREVLQGTDIELPAPESFAAHVDISRVAALGIDGFTAVPSPHGIGLETWQQLFQRAAHMQPALLSVEEPFVIASEAVREFGLLDTVLASEAFVAPSGHAGVRWSLRFVPDGPAPAVLGLNFEHGPHITMPEMLMLQLMRVCAGEQPLDQASFTWLRGDLAGGKLAARHVYDAADRAVRISCREIGNQGPHLGARVPVSMA